MKLTTNRVVLAVAVMVLLVGSGIFFSQSQHELIDSYDQPRRQAFKEYQQGNYSKALAEILHALQVTRTLPALSVKVVESYDDAGLYFYSTRNFELSVRHQAIAVLLAQQNPELKNMLPVYWQRLYWAWSQYRPNDDFSRIYNNPILLLQDKKLALIKDVRIREYFSKGIHR